MLQIFIGLIVVIFMGLFVIMSLPMMRDTNQKNDEAKSK